MLKSLTVTLCFVFAISTPLLTEEYLTNIQTKASFEVTDLESSPFNSYTWEELQSMFAKRTPLLDLPKHQPTKVANYNFPTSYNFYDWYPNCRQPCGNQGKCGSCWAWSGTYSLAQRFCKVTSQNIVLSPQFSVSCNTDNKSCDYGKWDNTWSFFEDEGIVTEKCFPYVSKDFFVPECPTKCEDSTEEFKLYKAKFWTSRALYNEMMYKEEILNNGPIQAGMGLYLDFITYKSGIYTVTPGSWNIGAHAIVLYGWGVEEDGSEYWWGFNSWGEQWGENGHFKIKFNESLIEGHGYVGLPDV